MSQDGISLDKAELLSVILEALLYGFSLLMFGATIWTLIFRRSTNRVNRRMLTAACLLLLGSTVHMVINIIRIIQGLILYRDTYPGGPIAYFADVSQWTFVSKSCVFTIQTLVGDSVVLYRCCIVWQSKLVLILPALLWCATAVTGIGIPYTAARAVQSGVFVGTLAQWITSFWASALATNLSATLLLLGRIWYTEQKVARFRGDQKSQLRPILRALRDAGAIYSLTLFVALICFVNGSNSQYVMLAMVMPIISITFYMVIIHTGLATAVDHSASRERTWKVEPRRSTQVYITKLTETTIHDAERSSSPDNGSSENRRHEVKLADIGEVEEV